MPTIKEAENFQCIQEIITKFMKTGTLKMSCINDQIDDAFTSSLNLNNQLHQKLISNLKLLITNLIVGTYNLYSYKLYDCEGYKNLSNQEIIDIYNFLGSHYECCKKLFQNRRNNIYAHTVIAVQSKLLLPKQFISEFSSHDQLIINYNRDRVFFILDSETKIPLSYVFLNGSLDMIATWVPAIKLLQDLQIKNCEWICYDLNLSNETILLLERNGMHFTYKVPETTHSLKRSINNAICSLNWSDALTSNPAVLGHKYFLDNEYNLNRYLFVFQDQEAKLKESIKFMEDIHKLKSRIEKDPNYCKEPIDPNLSIYDFMPIDFYVDDNSVSFCNLDNNGDPDLASRRYNDYQERVIFTEYRNKFIKVNKNTSFPSHMSLPAHTSYCWPSPSNTITLNSAAINDYCNLLSSFAFISNTYHSPEEIYSINQAQQNYWFDQKDLYSDPALSKIILSYKKHTKDCLLYSNNKKDILFLDVLNLFKGRIFVIFLATCLYNQIKEILISIKTEIDNRIYLDQQHCCVDKNGYSPGGEEMYNYKEFSTWLDNYMLDLKSSIGRYNPHVVLRVFLGLEDFNKITDGYMDYDYLNNLHWLDPVYLKAFLDDIPF